MLLVVALVSALTAMRFAIHVAEVAVPNLVGKTPAEARKMAEDNGLQFLVERQYYSDAVPEGRVLSQLPVAGTRVRSGWEVRVAESLGKQRVEIPNVLGESQRAAELNIQRRGLDVASVAQIAVPGALPEQILSQNPLPNASGVSAPNVSLLISRVPDPQPLVMANFTGQTLGSASSVLLSAGWHTANITATVTPSETPAAPAFPAAAIPPVTPTPSSLIITQIPPSGAKVLVGAPVSFVVR